MNAMAETLFQDQTHLTQFLGHSHAHCFDPSKGARDFLCNAGDSKDITKALEKVGIWFVFYMTIVCGLFGEHQLHEEP